jgi:hypothetical protein
VADQTALKLKGLSLLVFLVCGYYSVGYLSEPNELLDFSKSNRIEALFRLVFVLATLLAGLAAPGLYLRRRAAARLALAAGALLSCHLIFVLAESFSVSTVAELPFSFFSLFFWLMLYGADLLGPCSSSCCVALRFKPGLIESSAFRLVFPPC